MKKRLGKGKEESEVETSPPPVLPQFVKTEAFRLNGFSLLTNWQRHDHSVHTLNLSQRNSAAVAFPRPVTSGESRLVFCGWSAGPTDLQSGVLLRALRGFARTSRAKFDNTRCRGHMWATSRCDSQRTTRYAAAEIRMNEKKKINNVPDV